MTGTKANYYIPSIDEFHNGFVYYKNNRPVECEIELDPYSARVKYLDEDDILELGFEYEDNNTYVKIINGAGMPQVVKLLITYAGNVSYVTIVDNSNKIIMKGFRIMNKSELMFILNRFGY